MPVFSQDLNIDQGADFSFVSPPYVVDGVVQDFTNAHCRMMVRILPTDPVPLLSLTDTAGANGGVTPNGAAGTVTVAVKKVAASALPAVQPLEFDVFVDKADGTSIRLMAGRVFVG